MYSAIASSSLPAREVFFIPLSNTLQKARQSTHWRPDLIPPEGGPHLMETDESDDVHGSDCVLVFAFLRKRSKSVTLWSMWLCVWVCGCVREKGWGQERILEARFWKQLFPHCFWWKLSPGLVLLGQLRHTAYWKLTKSSAKTASESFLWNDAKEKKIQLHRSSAIMSTYIVFKLKYFKYNMFSSVKALAIGAW